jgi:hypothetical protein
MDIEKIIEDVGKYHYVGCGDKKCKIMASSYSKSEAKDNAFKFLDDHWDDLIGSIIYLVTIRKSTKDKEEWNKEKNLLLPGPIYMEITEYIVKKKEKIKEIGSVKNRQVFFTEKYIKKNNGISKKDIADLVKKFASDELKKGVMESNII